MKFNTESISEHIRKENLDYRPFQIDGVPEGFGFKSGEMSIGGRVIPEEYVAFIPSSDVVIKNINKEELLKDYQEQIKIRDKNGK